MKHEVAELLGRKIEFPDDLMLVASGNASGFGREDSVLYETGAKIVVFVDSSDCNECSLKWSEWALLSRQFHKDRVGVPLVFIVNAGADRLQTLALNHRFDYHLFAGSDEFLRLNGLPDGELYHVFLLDRDNGVRVVGSPLNGEALADLYRETLASLKENGNP